MSDSETARLIFCPSCGEPTTPVPFCRYCGAQMNGGQQKLPSTGLGQPPAAAVADPAEPRPRRTLTAQKRGLVWVVGVVGVLIVLGLAGLTLQKFGVVPKTGNSAAIGQPTASSVSHGSGSFPEGDKYVAAVREGVLSAPYNTTTVGKAFEATFTDWKWGSGETEKGERVVEFMGRLKPDMYKYIFDLLYDHCVNAPGEDAKRYNDELARCPTCTAPLREVAPPLTAAEAATKCPNEVAFSTVTFQFVFSADGSSFTMGYIDQKPWSNTSLYEFHGYETRTPQYFNGRYTGDDVRHVGETYASKEDILAYIYH